MSQKNTELGTEIDPYDRLEQHFPRMFSRSRDVWVDEGWLDIVQALCVNIQHYVDWKRSSRARDLMRRRAAKKGHAALVKWMTTHRNFDAPTDWLVQQCHDIIALGAENLVITPKVNHVYVAQIKEKFGELRFYYDGGDEYVGGLVSMAETWASHTCEVCGSSGTLRHGGWMRTLCDKHEAERQERNKY